MKPDKAIGIIESVEVFSDKYYFNPDEISEARDMAIEALEKQIPKKPIREDIGGGLHYLHCTTCGRKIIDLEWRVQPFCWKCGSAIDWS